MYIILSTSPTFVFPSPAATVHGLSHQHRHPVALCLLASLVVAIFYGSAGLVMDRNSISLQYPLVTAIVSATLSTYNIKSASGGIKPGYPLVQEDCGQHICCTKKQFLTLCRMRARYRKSATHISVCILPVTRSPPWYIPHCLFPKRHLSHSIVPAWSKSTHAHRGG